MTEIKVMYPMLASGGTNADKWDSPEWWAEEKIDGSRYLCFMGDTGNRFTSRQKSRQTGKPVEKTDNVPHLSTRIYEELEGTVLDGEIQHRDFSKTVSVMGSLPERAFELQQQIGWIDYHVFDILFYNGEDVRNLPYKERRKLVEEVIKYIDYTHFKMTEVVKEDKKSFYHNIVKNGGEGVILKNVDSTYENGARCKEWIKVKKYITDDVVIMGADIPTRYYTGKNKGEWEYKETDAMGITRLVTRAWAKGWIGAIKFGKYKDGTLIPLGQTSGIDDEIKELLSDGKHGIKKEYLGRVMEIGAMEQIKKSGAYRHPRFLRLRPDKNAEDCVWE